jgi:flagella basal body P-ring formation protein FlgA
MRCQTAPTEAQPHRRTATRRAVLALLTGFACSGAAPVAHAVDAATDALVTQFVQQAVGEGYRVDVEVGQLDPRIRLAPCARLEPYVPGSARLWGRTLIGVRCVEGASWNVSLPIHVRVYGQALVANTTLLAGTAASEADFRLAEVDLTREGRNLIGDPGALANRTLSRPIAAGQPLRADHLRVAQVVSPGDPVRIRLLGTGFEIASEGVALSGAGEGQVLRVRTENGRVLSGTARGRIVEIRL